MRRWLLILVVMVVGVGAFGMQQQAQAQSADYDFKETACRFDSPRDRDITCGDLIVPEDRSNPDSPTIRIHVAVLHSLSPNPAPDPVIYLDGGPGFSSLVSLPQSYEVIFRPILAERDVVVFDQRGIGYSEPSLTCPETTHGQDFMACWRRLENTDLNLAAYNSAESAADVAALRKALGYDEWNLFGTSYGTRLALTIMRDHPEGVRSALLDGVYPPEVDIFAEFPANVNRAFSELFNACAADDACNTAYPELESVFYEYTATLEETPASYNVPHGGVVDDQAIELDAFFVFNYLYSSLYDENRIPDLPYILYESIFGNYDAMFGLHDPSMPLAFSEGLYYALQCTEEMPFSSRQKWQTVSDQYPELLPYVSTNWVFGLAAYDICERLDLPANPNPIENSPVVSDIPTLLFSGQFDPITPPEWGERAAKSLTQSHAYTFPAMGHVVFVGHPCPRAIAFDFWRAPDITPNASCIMDMEPPTFYIFE